MQINKSPMFRREAVPWYRSTPMGVLALLVLAAVILLGILGVKVALVRHTYADFVWVPLLLLAASGYLFASISVRLVRRRWMDASS